MKISIITACFNSAATLLDTLERVRSQSYPDDELIVIDGIEQRPDALSHVNMASLKNSKTPEQN